jgi:hypothetical protein
MHLFPAIIPKGICAPPGARGIKGARENYNTFPGDRVLFGGEQTTFDMLNILVTFMFQRKPSSLASITFPGGKIALIELPPNHLAFPPFNIFASK